MAEYYVYRIDETTFFTHIPKETTHMVTDELYSLQTLAMDQLTLEDAFGGLERLISYASNDQCLPLYGTEVALDAYWQFGAARIDFSPVQIVEEIADILSHITLEALANCYPEAVKENSFMRAHSLEYYQKKYMDLQAFYMQAAADKQIIFRVTGY